MGPVHDGLILFPSKGVQRGPMALYRKPLRSFQVNTDRKCVISIVMAEVVSQGLVEIVGHLPRIISREVYFEELYSLLHTYIHTYHSRFIPEGVAEVSQIFLRDTHVLPKLVSYKEHCRRDRW
jgi:hypothetical protein